MTTNNPNHVRTAIAGTLAWLMVLTPLGQSAQAALTILADQPIAAKVAAKPNLLYTFDNSGSMSLNYIPDWVINADVTPGNFGYCRATGGTASAACTNSYVRGLQEPMFAADFNRLYYNPNVNYDPPVDGAGNQASMAFPDGAPAATIYKMQTSAKTAAWTAVLNDRYLGAGTVALNGGVDTQVYCNTDWPVSPWAGALAAPTVWSEVGNVYGEYSAGSGQDCRINGTSYDAVNGAPAIVDDYNYPYQKNTGANDPKYFWRNGNNNSAHRFRYIYCKRSGPGWPKTTAGCPWTCTLGGTLTYPVNQVQTCNAGGTVQGPPWSYSPTPLAAELPLGATCDVNPLYQWTWATGGCVGTIGVECKACNRTGIIVTRNANCSITGAACGTTGSPAPPVVVNGNPACPNTTGTTPTGCTVGVLTPPAACNPATSALCSTPYFGGGGTLLDDANGAGVTCQHNNNSGAYVTNRFSLPQTPALTTNYSFAVSDASCGNIPATVRVPRYYYTIASVQYCDLLKTGAAWDNNQWRGFGRGTCQTRNDVKTFKTPLYGKFTRIGLVNDGRVFNYVDPFTGVAGTRTFAEEMTNFANWHAYYRTRVLAAKTTTAIAFNIVDNTYRAGFHTMSDSNLVANWLDAGDFTAAHRANWYAKLFGQTIGVAKTPTLDALIRIGQLVENGAGAVAGLPGHTDPIPTVAGNPVSCTANFHILFTDGTTDQTSTPTLVGEVDGSPVPAPSATVLPTEIDPINHPERTVASLQALAGSPWPHPYRDVPTATPNSLADIALNFWMRDLRTGAGFDNDVPAHDGRAGADLDWTKDPAFWQHVNLSALSYGAGGLLDSTSVIPTTMQIAAGTKPWFTAPYYPAPPHNAASPAFYRRAPAVDDLWHATVNGRGKFVYADTPIEIAYGLGSIISGISNNRKARVGATFASPTLCAAPPCGSQTVANDFLFQATIEPAWAGELKKVTINTVTGVEGAVRWSAAGKLNALLTTPAIAPALDSDNPWFLNRRVVTRNLEGPGFNVVPFRWADLNTGTKAQLLTLSSNATQQQKIVAYLRGGSTFGPGPAPLSIEGPGVGQFRSRASKLGNISDSKPVIVGPANKPFTDANDFGYSAYKAAHATRALRVFVGANDGMFHVFNGTDDSGVGTGGTEMYAYVPSGVFTNAFDEGGKARKGIQALTYQDGGAPIFKHHFYVNAPPKTQDVDFANCGTNSTCTSDWRTIVVSGLGKGGNTYFALDATNVAVANEVDAAAKVLWEFALPNSQFSFGEPIIAKTRADGWVVVIASGYNNTGDGKGHLYFLNAATGALLRTLNTTAADTGSAASPSGLAQIRGYVADDANQILEQIYGGDLNGRLWRWDVSSASAAAWQAQTRLFANLIDPSSAPQPITTAPEIEIDPNNGVDRYVFIGTGRLLDPSDLTFPVPEQVQTAYAIRDGTLGTPSNTGLPIAPRATLAPIVGMLGVATTAPNGWYHDLPLGQRVVVDVVAEFGLFAYVGTVLQPDPCLTSLPAYIYARDYVSGESLVFTGGAQQPHFYSQSGAVGLELVALEVPSSSFPQLAIVFTKETNATIEPVEIRPKAFGGGHRLSWRLLAD